MAAANSRWCKPGDQSPQALSPQERTTEGLTKHRRLHFCRPPPGLRDHFMLYPGLTPGAINLPPALAGSLNAPGLS